MIEFFLGQGGKHTGVGVKKISEQDGVGLEEGLKKETCI